MKIALIGCGAVADVLYARALAQLAQEGLAETIALVDPNPARTAQIGKTLRESRPYRDLGTMLTEACPDLAIIATPHRFHAEQTVACLENGVHVLCEKPMAATVADCDRMIAAAQKAGRILAVGHFRRFFPSCQIIKDTVAAGLLGAVRSFCFLDGETYSWPIQTAFFSKRAEAGGGVLMDTGAHTIDLLLWWLGDVAQVQYQDDAMGGIEASCRAYLQMASGAEGIVQLSRDWPLPNRYVVECEKGWIAYICDVVDRVELGLYGSAYGINAQIQRMANSAARKWGMRAGVPNFRDCFTAQLRNVLAAIRGTEPLRVPGEEASKSVALIERCYRNRQLLDMPWLDDVELRRAREMANV